MESSKEESFQMDSKNELNSLIQGFLDNIDAAKSPNSDHMEVQRSVHDCIYLLLRLGYEATTIQQLTGVDDKFFQTTLNQLGLPVPSPTLTSIPNEKLPPPNVTNNHIEKIVTTSNIESFMETVQSVKEQSRNSRSQSLPPVEVPQQEQHPTELSSHQTVSTGKNWLSKSKVSLNDSDSDEEEEKQSVTNTTNSQIRQKDSQVSKPLDPNPAFPLTRLVTVSGFCNEEMKFQKVIKDRLKKLSNVDIFSKHGSSSIEETRNKLISDVNKFTDYVAVLRNRQVMKFVESHSTGPVSQPLRKTSLPTESQSSNQDTLINDSFVKMTKSKTQSFTPYKPVLPNE
ncbi:hypothetical protein MOSE0_L01596 [Monosporozyma servazzii]